jgi:hypothetical protein
VGAAITSRVATIFKLTIVDNATIRGRDENESIPSIAYRCQHRSRPSLSTIINVHEYSVVYMLPVAIISSVPTIPTAPGRPSDGVFLSESFLPVYHDSVQVQQSAVDCECGIFDGYWKTSRR